MRQEFDRVVESSEPLLIAAAPGTIRLPVGEALLDAEFARSGHDLNIIVPESQPLLIENYFAAQTTPSLLSTNGKLLEGELIERLVGSLAPMQYAGEVGAKSSIGKVEKLQGEVTVQHADGSTTALKQGDDVFQDDVIKTAGQGAIGIKFTDGSVFTLGENARMTLDKLVFDPATGEGEQQVSVMKGMFKFVSGEVAANNPGDMTIKTPVATIGVRGTTGGGQVTGENQDNQFYLEANADGTVGWIDVKTEAGTQSINQPNMVVGVKSIHDAPPEPKAVDPQQLQQKFGEVINFAPPVDKYNQRKDGEPQAQNESKDAAKDDQQTEAKDAKEGDKEASEAKEANAEQGEEAPKDAQQVEAKAEGENKEQANNDTQGLAEKPAGDATGNEGEPNQMAGLVSDQKTGENAGETNTDPTFSGEQNFDGETQQTAEAEPTMGFVPVGLASSHIVEGFSAPAGTGFTSAFTPAAGQGNLDTSAFSATTAALNNGGLAPDVPRQGATVVPSSTLTGNAGADPLGGNILGATLGGALGGNPTGGLAAGGQTGTTGFTPFTPPTHTPNPTLPGQDTNTGGGGQDTLNGGGGNDTGTGGNDTNTGGNDTNTGGQDTTGGGQNPNTSGGNTNQHPIAYADNISVNEDGSLTINIASQLINNDTDAEGAVSFHSILASTTNGTLVNNGNGTLTYTPTTDFSGSDSFTYKITDSKGAAASATVTITVNSINDLPTATNNNVSTNEDTPLTISIADLLANDSDIESAVSFDSSFTLSAPNGTVVNNGDGTLTYTPDANHHGTDSFSYRVTDGQSGTATATVNITVNSVNDAPTGSVSDQTATAGSSFTFDIPNGAFTDADGDTINYSATLADGNPLSGSWLTFDDVNNRFTGTPGAPGSLDVKIIASDGTLSHNSVFTITVGTSLSASNLTHMANYTEDTNCNLTDIVVMGAAGTVTATLTLSDPAAGTLSTSTSGGTTSTYNPTTGVWEATGTELDVNALLANVTFTPAANAHDNITIDTHITDGTDTIDGTITLNGISVNDLPTVDNLLANQTVTEYEPLSYQFNASSFGDVDAGDTLTYTATLSNGAALPGWLAFDDATRTFSGTPGNSDVGTITVKVTATDDDGLSIYDEFTIDVNQNVSNDNITLTAGNDNIFAEGGDDTIHATNSTWNATDAVRGGDGNDFLDIIGGGAINLNSITTFNGIENITVDNSDTTLTLNNDALNITTGNGANTITLGNATQALTTGTGADSVTMGIGSQNLTLGAGNDTVFAAAGTIGSGDAVHGGAGNNQLTLTSSGSFSLNSATITGINTVNLDGSGPNTVTMFNGAGANVYGGAGVDNITLGTNGQYGNGGAGHDHLTGNSGDDTLIGGAGDDTLDGQGGNDQVDYGSQSGIIAVNLASGEHHNLTESDDLSNIETVIGGTSATAHNILIGSVSTNRLEGGNGRDFLVGGGGDDTLTSGFAADVMIVNSGNVVLDGDMGKDHFEMVQTSTLVVSADGGDDNDTFFTSGGTSGVLSGGAGDDEFEFDDFTGSMNISGATGTTSSIAAGDRVFYNSYNSNGSLTLNSNGQSGYVHLDFGHQDINAFSITESGSNLLIDTNGGTAGGVITLQNFFNGSNYNRYTLDFTRADGTKDVRDLSTYTTGHFTKMPSYIGVNNDTMLKGSVQNDSITGYNDTTATTLYGQDGDDTLSGYQNDMMLGEAGNDRLVRLDSINNATLNGGAGNNDIADYSNLAPAITVNLNAGTMNASGMNDSLVDIERVIGTANSDTFTGKNGPGAINIFEGGGSGDNFGGGTGGAFNMVSYASSGAYVNVNLNTNSAANSHANGDFFSNIQHLEGSSQGDTLIGSDSDSNKLIGGEGNDKLSGYDLGDTLIGGMGNDTIYTDDTVGGSDMYRDTIVLQDALGTDTVFGFGTVGGAAQQDVLDISDLVRNSTAEDANYFNLVQQGYLSFAPNSGNAQIKWDADGSAGIGSYTVVGQLNNVADTNLKWYHFNVTGEAHDFQKSTAGGTTLSDSGIADYMVGFSSGNSQTFNAGVGNDIMELNGGTGNILNAGAGDDLIVLNNVTSSNNIAGGDGEDTLLIKNSTLNFSSLTAASIETLELNSSTVTLSASDVLPLSPVGTGHLEIEGNGTLNLSGTWYHAGSHDGYSTYLSTDSNQLAAIHVNMAHVTVSGGSIIG